MEELKQILLDSIKQLSVKVKYLDILEELQCVEMYLHLYKRTSASIRKYLYQDDVDLTIYVDNEPTLEVSMTLNKIIEVVTIIQRMIIDIDNPPYLRK